MFTTKAVSRSIGLYMMDAFNIQTQVCNFDNLSYLLMVCHMWLPLVGVPLSFMLLPKQRLSDDLLGVARVTLAPDRTSEAVRPLKTETVTGSYGSTDC